MNVVKSLQDPQFRELYNRMLDHLAKNGFKHKAVMPWIHELNSTSDDGDVLSMEKVSLILNNRQYTDVTILASLTSKARNFYTKNLKARCEDAKTKMGQPDYRYPIDYLKIIWALREKGKINKRNGSDKYSQFIPFNQKQSSYEILAEVLIYHFIESIPCIIKGDFVDAPILYDYKATPTKTVAKGIPDNVIIIPRDIIKIPERCKLIQYINLPILGDVKLESPISIPSYKDFIGAVIIPIYIGNKTNGSFLNRQFAYELRLLFEINETTTWDNVYDSINNENDHINIEDNTIYL